MRILLVADFPDDPTLGSARVPHALREAFGRLGHECDALFAGDLGHFPRQRHARDLAGPWLAARAIVRAVGTRGPYDVVDVAGGEGAAFASLRRRSAVRAALVSRSNGLEHLNYMRLIDDARAGLVSKPWHRRIWYPAVRLRQVRCAVASSDRLILINDRDRAFVVDQGWKRPEAIDVIGHGVSERFVEAPAATAARGAGALFCGSWDAVKGAPYLAAAWRILAADGGAPPLTILGGGRSAAAILADFDATCRHAVTVIDRAPEDEVRRQYRRHDLLVMCSTYEGFGLVVPEAMSQRLAVITTPVGAAVTLVRDGETGIVVPPRDPGAIARAVRRLLDDANGRARLGEAAMHAVRDLSWTATARQTIEAYERARASRGCR